MHEFDYIKTYFAPLSQDGLINDGALLPVADNKKLIVTTDTIIRDVHFLAHTPAKLIAQKALRQNLSDLAAMGAVPLSYSLALSLSVTMEHASLGYDGSFQPPYNMEEWLSNFTAGLKQDQDTYNIVLLGGDTTSSSGPEVVTITAYGSVENMPLTRSGAQPGDAVYVSGTIGDGALGLHCVKENIQNNFLIDRFHLPQPRLNLGAQLHGIASACLDISDGLLQDAEHIAQQSDIAIELHASHIPLSTAAVSLIEQHPALAEKIYAGGDDYELLFTAPSSQADTIAALATTTHTSITRIGRCIGGNGVTLLDENDKNITPDVKGWKHF